MDMTSVLGALRIAQRSQVDGVYIIYTVIYVYIIYMYTYIYIYIYIYVYVYLGPRSA